MSLTDFQRELCETSEHDFTDLARALRDCTLKPSPERSHTQGLVDVSVAIMEADGVAVDQFRAVDHDLAAERPTRHARARQPRATSGPRSVTERPLPVLTALRKLTLISIEE